MDVYIIQRVWMFYFGFQSYNLVLNMFKVFFVRMKNDGKKFIVKCYSFMNLKKYYLLKKFFLGEQKFFDCIFNMDEYNIKFI